MAQQHLDVPTVQSAIGVTTPALVTKIVPMMIAVEGSIGIGDVRLLEKRLPGFAEVLNVLAAGTPEGKTLGASKRGVVISGISRDVSK